MEPRLDLFEEAGFGRFDPTNFGITINIDPALEHPDFAVLGQLMWVSLHFEPDGAHREYVASCDTAEDAAFAATCFTAFAHEARHFHDALATPYGATLGRLFTRAEFLHALLWEELLHRSRGVVVPLSDWITHRAEYTQAYPELPPPSPTVRDIAAQYAEIKRKHALANAGLAADGHMQLPTATGILEASAISVQQLTIAHWFGIPVAETFSRGILERPSGQTYFGVQQLVQAVAGGPIPMIAFTFLCLASLFGDALDPNPERARCPTDVLLDLLSWLRDHGVALRNIRSFDAIYEPVVGYFHAHHDRDLTEMAEASSAANKGMHESLSATLAEIEARQSREMPAARSVLASYECLIEAQRVMANTVARDPEQYCGEQYRANIYRLPKPVINVSSAIGVTVDAALEELYEIWNEDHLVISQEARAHLHDIPDLSSSQREWLATAPVARDGRIVLRNAHVLRPRVGLLHDAPNMPNLDRWRTRKVQPGMRLFFEGPDGIPRRELAQVVGLLKLAGTTVYSDEELLGADLDLADFDPVAVLTGMKDKLPAAKRALLLDDPAAFLAEMTGGLSAEDRAILSEPAALLAKIKALKEERETHTAEHTRGQ